MKTKQIGLKLALVATLGITVFSLMPMVIAGPPRFMQELNRFDNLLMPWWWGWFYEDPPGSGNWYFQEEYVEFDSSANLYFRIGAAVGWEELENDWWPKPPWEYRLWINGEEIVMERYAVKGNQSIIHPPVSMFWYHIFGPDYFTAGETYLLKWEFWVKGPYQGDGLNYWRPFVDYWGVYAPPGTVSSYEYYLNIV
ncbi:MAG: hypothetical protein ACFFA7_13485 [Promethearchaeota archaeon]